MNTNRFETFFDAVLAIIITVIVLKLNQPVSPTWPALLDLKTGIITYFIVFLVIFIIWYDNHNLFHVIEEIDNRVLSIYALQIFAITLFPYFASWVSRDLNSIAAETMFGLDYILISILYYLSIYAIYRANPYVCSLSKAHFMSIYKFIPLIINIVGFIISYTLYTPAIYVSVLISLVFWLFFSRLQEPDSGNTERFEALFDAIIAIILTIIVLELPLALNGSWEAFFELKLEFIVYAISFLVCINFWLYNNNLFQLVNRINPRVIWSIAASLFVFSLIPYLTTFVGMNFNSFVPNFLYGFDFIIVACLSIVTAEALKSSDKANIALQLALGSNKYYMSTIIIVILGMIVGYLFYPPTILFSCIVSIILLWLIPHLYKIH